LAQQPKLGLDRFTVKVSRSHTIRHTLKHLVGLCWQSAQLVAKATICTVHNKHKTSHLRTA